MAKPTVLFFGRDELLHHKLKTRLARHGFRVSHARETSDVIKTFNAIKPELVIIYSTQKNTDDRIEIIEEIRRKNRYVPIILSTRFSSEERVIAALRAGANDYFRVPISSDKLLLSAKKLILEKSNDTIVDFKAENSVSLNKPSLIGKSKMMREVKTYLLKVAKTDSTVLITGETGTGKELAAGLIHFMSSRSNKPFVCVNCAALPEGLVESELFGYDRGAFTGAFRPQKGKFEKVNGGTIFLDEIGDMTSYAQAKILRSIENKEFSPLGGRDPVNMNARVIAATNQDPERLVLERNFRKDLYYRLNVARVHMPPLRERKEDIPRLVKYAIQKLSLQSNRDMPGLSDEAMSCLFRYDWPGNVRELMNIIEAIYIYLPRRSTTFIGLPEPIKKQLGDSEVGKKEERKKIISALVETNWNKSTAAKNLEWSRMTLYRKMGKYNIVETRKR